jgi:hypothetical protein
VVLADGRDGFVDERLQLRRWHVDELAPGFGQVWSSTRHLTASSMNFDRSPFFMPRCARKLHALMSVSLETEAVQRVVSSGMGSPYRRLCAYQHHVMAYFSI